MSLTLRTSPSIARRGPSLARVWRALRAAVKRIERQAALRRELERMDDHMLSDIGVSRAQLNFEVDHDRRHPRA